MIPLGVEWMQPDMSGVVVSGCTSFEKKRSPGKSLKTLSAPVPGGVASEVTLPKSPRGRGSEHFPGKLKKDQA
jgi:hypothetical protein